MQNAKGELKNDENIANQAPTEEPITDNNGERPALSNNVSDVSEVSEMPKMSTNQYQSEGPNSKTMCPIVSYDRALWL